MKAAMNIAWHGGPDGTCKRARPSATPTGPAAIPSAFNQENIRYMLPTQDAFSWTVGNVRLTMVQRLHRKIPWIDRKIKKAKKKASKPVENALPPTE
jgi:phosphatidylserine/phosphatidylglycerophosphate/cardiolipin synthase-like enzyme